MEQARKEARQGSRLWRWIIYIVGMLFLALGIVLNSKSGLGMAPILSGMFCLSEIYGWNFSLLTLLYYILLVAAQFAIRGRNYRLADLLQIPLSIGFTAAMEVFKTWIVIVPDTLWQKLGVAFLAVIFTGVGITMAVNMRILPNPGDGIVQAISDRTGLSLGAAKNCFDGGSALIGVALGLILRGKLIGVGLGTIINVVFIGRVVWASEKLFKKPMLRLTFGEQREAPDREKTKTA